MLARFWSFSHRQWHIYQLKIQADSLKSGANGDEADTTPADASQTPKNECLCQCVCVSVLVSVLHASFGSCR